jgi:hypothetical protein
MCAVAGSLAGVYSFVALEENEVGASIHFQAAEAPISLFV